MWIKFPLFKRGGTSWSQLNDSAVENEKRFLVSAYWSPLVHFKNADNQISENGNSVTDTVFMELSADKNNDFYVISAQKCSNFYFGIFLCD